MTGETIAKETGMYAAEMYLGESPYQYARPSQLLAMLVRNSDKGEPFQYSKSMAERLVKRLPKEMVGLAYSKDGTGVNFQKNAINADFLGAGSAGSTVAGSGIVPILMIDSIMEGAMAYTCCRDMLQVTQLRVEGETMPFFTAKGTVPASAYGAEAYDLAQEMGKALSATKSYKLTCGLAKELLADAQGDLLGAAMKEMGGTMEVTLDTVCIEGLTAAADSTATSVASASNELKGLIAANGSVGANKFRPDAAIMHPLFCAGAMAQFVPAYNVTAQAWVADTNILGKWAGMKLGRSGVSTATAANWAWASTNDYGAFVIDSTKAGMIGMREDMTFAEFENVVKWVQNPVLVSRFCYIAPVDADKTARNNKQAIRRLKKAA